ncbi:type IX secretion system membrane protein, PorP/SprF family [Parapedobacter composti]|uniref:Type IX secretion system membrane protein, PorP/SprF family n=1 Tax=Parapedobacter composti TaxID=623281 RepID=A0A1I1JZ43_9SPHI|nr:PorP/SprF family type IX secretion system membrane protein [Parapedobacter composti]SFC53959.1 type IX secretion system membrane protein, PorP/SprF family [Parapedobacter composti]
MNTNIKSSSRYILALLTTVVAVGIAEVSAQLSPMGTGYFQNPYLFNPARAGMEGGTTLNLGIRATANTMPGAPRNQAFTAEHGFGRSGIGLVLDNTSVGSVRHTGGSLGYAYHLPLAADHQLHFGLSATLSRSRLDMTKVNATGYDPVLAAYNERGARLDANFGLAYTFSELCVEFAMGDLIRNIEKDERQLVNNPLFFSAVSYTLPVGDGSGSMALTPKVCYRGARGTGNILDVGLDFRFAERFRVLGLYHTSENASFGFGARLGNLQLLGMYSLETSSLSRYAGNAFEVGLGWRIGN